MKQQKTLNKHLLLFIIILAFFPHNVLAQDAKSNDTSQLVGEYTTVSIAYNFLRSCNAANPNDGEKIQSIMLNKKESLFKKHSFSSAEKSNINKALSNLPQKVKKTDPYACYLSMDTAKQNLKIWLPSE